MFLLCRRMRNISKSGPESLRVAAKQLLETWKQKVAALPAAGNKRCDRHLLYTNRQKVDSVQAQYKLAGCGKALQESV